MSLAGLIQLILRTQTRPTEKLQTEKQVLPASAARRGVSWPRTWRQGAASDQHFPLRGRGENQKHIEPGRDRGDGGSEKVVSPWHR